jgi:hypothetical protein
VVAVAEAFAGLPYVWAGTSAQSGFDCSGYIYEVMRLNGYAVPRMADHQFEESRRVEKADLKRGDMVFFTTYLPGPSHVGIYLGDGEFIHASSAGEGVVVSQLRDGYYAERFLGGGRPDGWIIGDLEPAAEEGSGVLVSLTSEPTDTTLDTELEEAPDEPETMEPVTAPSVGPRDPFELDSSGPTAMPFDEQVDNKAEAAGLSLQLQLGEMLAVGQLKASEFFTRLSTGLSALSPLGEGAEHGLAE